MKCFPFALTNKVITVGARASKLSLKQVEEMVDAMRYHYPELCFAIYSAKTYGDCQQNISLRTLEKTDFFTKELDQWLLKGKCRISVHSAKDLPDPIPQGLQVIAITASLNSEDVVVFSQKYDLNNLPDGLTIATSSLNREQNILKQFPGAKVVDIRGTIDQRLEKVKNEEIDGVVIAKVALIRLGYNHLKMIKLEGDTTPLQGSLAVLARESDIEMKELFQVIDARRGLKCLYTGLDPKFYKAAGEVVHCPLIEIKHYPFSKFPNFAYLIDRASHLLLTSKTAVQRLFELMEEYQIPLASLDLKCLIAVGQKTAAALQERHFYVSYIAQNESQEGVIKVLNQLHFKPDSFLLYLKSAQARPLLKEYLKEYVKEHETLDLYETSSRILSEKPSLEDFDEIVFTSTSCVKSFSDNFKELPSHINVVCKGDVTRKYLNDICYSSDLSTKA